MPLYEYRCPDCGKVVERIRKYSERDDAMMCQDHDRAVVQMERIWSAHHAEPDGIYSYEPNMGSEEKFVRWNAKIEKQKEAELEARG